MSNVRWGLLSTANINRKLIPALRAAERAELTAVASRDTNAAKTYADSWEIPHAFGSYEAMLESDEIDAVYIGLPNHLHAEWTIKALEHGKHVLCEKPFALSVDEVDRMIDASHANDRVLAEAFMYRHHPQTKLAGELIAAGRLGQIRYVRIFFSYDLTDTGNVRLIPEFGGGALWDVGVYPLSFCQYVFGSTPDSVQASQRIGKSGVDMDFAAVMTYANGALAEIGCSFRVPSHTSVEVLGTKGRLVLTRPFIDLDERRMMTFYNEEDQAEEIVVPEKELYLGEVEDMNAAILDGDPTYLTLEESRNHVLTATALYQSAASRVTVHLQ